MTGERRSLSHLTDQELDAVAGFVGALRRRFDGEIQAVTLFGSRARGDAEPESDMDVLVVLTTADAPTVKEVRYLAGDVWLRHGVYLSTRVWSQAHWRRLEELQTLLYENIRRDGIDLLELDSTVVTAP
jgi:predicted nucleotidyltransferase